MSDGPHKSLPMRRGWKQVAQRGDSAAWDAHELAGAVVEALQHDAATDIGSDFAEHVAAAFRSPGLFAHRFDADIESLRVSPNSLQAFVIDKAVQLAESGSFYSEPAVDAVEKALIDRAARGARQVEEHYCRKSTQSRALQVRRRIDEAIGIATGQIREIAKNLLNANAGVRQQPRKHKGIDEGVRF